MTGDFNIRDSNWNLVYPFHSSYSDYLVEIAKSFDLLLSSAIQQVPTRYSDNANNSNSVINLMFLWLNSAEFNNHEIYPELWFSSDHTLLTINVIIKKEFILRRKHTIIKNSKEESEFIEDFTRRFRNIGMMFITDKAYFKSMPIQLI